MDSAATEMKEAQAVEAAGTVEAEETLARAEAEAVTPTAFAHRWFIHRDIKQETDLYQLPILPVPVFPINPVQLPALPRYVQVLRALIPSVPFPGLPPIRGLFLPVQPLTRATAPFPSVSLLEPHRETFPLLQTMDAVLLRLKH